MEAKIFGYPVALVLSDRFGEFEVRDAVRYDYAGRASVCDITPIIAGPRIDVSRVHDAIKKRELEMYSVGPRPVY